MASVWANGVIRSLEQALEQLALAVRECPEVLWDSSMWDVPALPPDHQFLGPNWAPVTDAAERESLGARWVLRRSTPWSVAWHALESLDYDLTGEFGPWVPPPPFAGHPHWRDLPSLPAPWSKAEVLGYVEYCGQRVRTTLAAMTEDDAARPLPAAHRCSGQPHAFILAGLASHTVEHAAQIRQFGVSRVASSSSRAET